MYCKECGNKTLKDAIFCTNCGAKLQASDESITLHESINLEKQNDQELEYQQTSLRSIAENSLRFKGSRLIKWIVLSLGLVIIASGLIYYFTQEQSITNNRTQHQSEKKQAITAKIEAKQVDNVPLKPLYIKVNQVNSTNYDKGKVDVYFSLFSDESLTEQVKPMSLTKKMFKVNGKPIKQVSLVKQAETVSVNLVIDRSGSMVDPPIDGENQSKMELVRQAAMDFLNNIPSDAKGNFELLTFSTYVPDNADIPFKHDREELVSYLANLESDGGQTALYDSLTKALYDTNEQDGPKYIIAFTDGQDSNYGASAYSVIELSKQLGIPIYTIGFGEADAELQEIGAQTGGGYFSINPDHNLNEQLQKIYNDVFEIYTQQYKVTYVPTQQVDHGELFTLDINMKTSEYQGATEKLQFMRKLDESSVDVSSALFEYQVKYAEAVNKLDFSLVSPYIKLGSEFYTNLQNRIEVDYVKANDEGRPKIIKPLEKYRVESIKAQSNGSYKIDFFKFFPVTINNEDLFEADLNTYTLVQDEDTGKWQVSDFGRKECSVYKNEDDPGSLYPESGVKKQFSRNPWTIN